MPSDLIEPSPGNPSVPPEEPPPPSVEPAAVPLPPPDFPAGLGSTSGDDLSMVLAQSRPDPLLGEFIEEKKRPGRKRNASSSSAELIPPIRLNLDGPRGASSRSDLNAGDDRDGISWPMLLLSSYASAVTFALIWVLWSGRRLPESGDPGDPPAVEAIEAGGSEVRADLSRLATEVAAPQRNAETTLGQSLVMDSLEVTPLSAEWSTVVLERNLTVHTFQLGGNHAIKLTLRLRNLSSNAIFTPLEEVFVRGGKELAGITLTEPNGRATRFALYPLSVESEWRIVDQEFLELGPGEEFDTSIFSAPNMPTTPAESLTWRLRLGTGVGTSANLAIHVKATEITAPGGRR